ncbi:MAG TPA: hypothetical protein VHH92_02375, partial [Actinomycetota bacterium]|nr:hypothetical protein [Actinomycetota bacterium]
MRIRYSRWDGSQDPLGPDLYAGELLDAMSEDLLQGEGADEALRRLLRRGMSGRITGTDALANRLREARRLEEQRLDLDGPLDEIADRLAEVLERERTTLSFHDDDDARLRETFLDTLPDDLPGRLRDLRDYRFRDPEAQRRFDELMGDLTEQMLDATFRSLARGLRDASPEQLRRVKDMLADLNAMIEAKERGEHTQEDFDAFMERHGDLFPDRPGTLDELLESLARRMAAMSRLLASLPPDRRRELEELARQVLGDLDLAFEAD